MALVFRWLLRVFLGLSVVLALTLGMAYYLASRSLPDYDASYKLDGVQSAVEIVRDTHGVPHIFADDDRDVYFGLGFVHAQDRMWQMMMMRRTAQGRLSEAFGEETLAIDDFIRRLDIDGKARASFEFQGREAKLALTAYADGVNAWLKVVQSEALGRGAPEFFLFSNEIVPWQPSDSLAIMRLMALRLSGQISREVLRARTSLLVPGERLFDILPDAPGEGLAALPDFAAMFPDALDVVASTSVSLQQPLDPVNSFDLAGASNAWAALPERSATGGTLLANDPHFGFSAPAIWMLARLELSSGGVIGGTIPGMPVVLVGRSEKLGWGITSAYLDDQDLFVEKLNPDNPDEYLTPDGFKAFETSTVLIDVKDSPSVTTTIRWTENGPVLPSDRYNIGTITPPGHVVSLAWTALDEIDTSMTASINIMSAATVTEALAAGRLFHTPAQNLVVVDRQNIAMQLIGKMPRRMPQHHSKGRIPAAGWLPENRWQGYFPYDQNPRFINPTSGLVANTNNKSIDRPFPLHVSYDWGDTQRIERLRKLLSARDVHTRESFVEGQLDAVSFTARSLLPLMAQDLWFSGDAAPRGTPAHRRQTALALLADWNGEMNEHLPEPLIFAAWLRALQSRLISDELGPLAAEFDHTDSVFIERVFRDVNGASVWCDVVQSGRVETCVDTARAALDDALISLSEDYGSDIIGWRWGNAHQALHDHEILGDLPVLSWFVNIRQDTSGGDNTLLRGRTLGSGPNPFANVHGAGYRGVYDFADPDSSVFIISTGQSGHPLSRHYDDLAQLWRRGEYIPMSLDPDLARAAASGVTTLSPASAP